MNKIQFTPSSSDIQDFVEPPVSASKCIPEWYSSIKNTSKNCPIFREDGKHLSTNLKMCMPFLDTLTSGYIQKTWTDIYIQHVDGKVHFNYSSSPAQMSSRETKAIPHYSDEFYDIEFVWYTPWVSQVPTGYSLLVTHPLNRLDLPFVTLSGIIDSDTYYHSPDGNQPFYIKRGFSGLIPAGTPMFQIIPIKRDSWRAECKELGLEAKRNFWQNTTKFWGFYKNNFWQRKDYK